MRTLARTPATILPPRDGEPSYAARIAQARVERRRACAEGRDADADAWTVEQARQVVLQRRAWARVPLGQVCRKHP